MSVSLDIISVATDQVLPDRVPWIRTRVRSSSPGTFRRLIQGRYRGLFDPSRAVWAEVRGQACERLAGVYVRTRAPARRPKNDDVPGPKTAPPVVQGWPVKLATGTCNWRADPGKTSHRQRALVMAVITCVRQWPTRR